ncbi:peptidoglycan recognition protein family protein [Bradyrhizobium sp. PMVTL-01]|uniref:peptidoglycan recognition protein family protein n=1 Tax=Bradyrhizobium sp. PMVTL-01 TaxID=3434999 RepID=UPI003F70F3B9
MQIGLISIGGRAIGTITLERADAPLPSYVPKHSMFQNASFDASDGYSAEAPSYGRSAPSPGHNHQPVGEAQQPPAAAPRPTNRFGGEGDTDPPAQPAGSGTAVSGNRVYGRLAEARDRARKELADNPRLNEKAMHIFAGENPDPTASTALWESAINRMAVRGTTLEKELRRTNEGGYYEGWRDEVSPSTRRVLEASRDKALAYSNVSNYATDNSSGNLAARENASGTFTQKSVYAREHFFGPDNRIASHQRSYRDLVANSEAERQRVGGAPAEGVAPNTAAQSPAAPNPAGQPGRVEGVDPQAFIMHHTGGRGTPDGVRNTLRQRGLGVEYIMDRDGNIERAGGPGSAHMMRGWGKGEGLSNSNTVGMEVIARDDKDVTPQQVEAARAFIAKNYPNTPVYGHGEVNPGHKEADEGMSIVNAIRSDRARAAATTATTAAKDPEEDKSK